MKAEERQSIVARYNERLTAIIIENDKLREDNKALWDLANWFKEKHPELLKSYFDGMILTPNEEKTILIPPIVLAGK